MSMGQAWCIPTLYSTYVQTDPGVRSRPSHCAGFRRALRNYTGATPMEIREAGGLEPVLDAFLATCGLGRHQPRGLFVV
jgi:hypothetical protein